MPNYRCTHEAPCSCEGCREKEALIKKIDEIEKVLKELAQLNAGVSRYGREGKTAGSVATQLYLAPRSGSHLLRSASSSITAAFCAAASILPSMDSALTPSGSISAKNSAILLAVTMSTLPMRLMIGSASTAV